MIRGPFIGNIVLKQPAKKGYIWMTQDFVTAIGNKPRRISVTIEWTMGYKLFMARRGAKGEGQHLPSWITMA